MNQRMEGKRHDDHAFLRNIGSLRNWLDVPKILNDKE